MKKIMMVDDEKDQFLSTKIAFEDAYGDEYSLILAKSGDECFKLLKDNEMPDLILLDIMMPELSGWEVFDKLKDNPSWKDIPILFLTARTDKIAENAGKFLAEDYIGKPVNTKELKNRIDNVLKKG